MFGRLLSGVGLFAAVGMFDIAPQPLRERAIAQTPAPPVALPPAEQIEPSLPLPSEPAPLPIEPPAAPPVFDRVLPSVPSLHPAPGSTPAPPAEIPFRLHRIEVLGNTVLQPEISSLIQPLLEREIIFEDLVNLRSAITQAYIDSGYVTSGAYVPNNQDLNSGVVQIRVIEGELERIEITGLQHLHQSYVRDRLELAAAAPLNQQTLVEALQLLQLNPLIRRVNAELTAGSAPGQNLLLVNIQEANAFSLSAGGDNYRSPSLGSAQLSVEAAHSNLLGMGDRLSAAYGRTAGLDQFNVSYAVPLNPQEGTLTLSYSADNGQIVEQAFANLGIRSDSQTYSIGFRQPLIRSPETEFALGFSVDLRRNQTFILDDEPYSFSEGADSGRFNLTILRFSQDWVDRNATRVLAARSQFSLGLNAFDATINSSTDGRFLSWLGQFQSVHQLAPRLLLVNRLAAQLSTDSLPSIERFGFGGVDTVRGYRQNQIVADNGILATLETRFALVPQNRLQLISFVDFGYGWNSRTDFSLDPLASVGLGLSWLAMPNLTLRADYGIPLIGGSDRGNSLQESGLYLSLQYQLF